MLRFRISTLLWTMLLVSIVAFFTQRDIRQQREIERLCSELQAEQQRRGINFGSNYEDIDVYVPETPTGSINISGTMVMP